MRAFVAGSPAPFTRATLAGHVTGSAMVLDPEGRALLLFHARLGLWVQPGGHMEPEDADVAAAALREAREESSLVDLALDLAGDGRPQILDVDVHPIPANPKRAEPAHFHHDVCFLARTADPDAAQIDVEESRALRWIPGSELAVLAVDPATRRRLKKAFALPSL